MSSKSKHITMVNRINICLVLTKEGVFLSLDMYKEIQIDNTPMRFVVLCVEKRDDGCPHRRRLWAILFTSISFFSLLFSPPIPLLIVERNSLSVGCSLVFIVVV